MDAGRGENRIDSMITSTLEHTQCHDYRKYQYQGMVLRSAIEKSIGTLDRTGRVDVIGI